MGWRLRIEHTTQVTYSGPVLTSFNEARMTPLTLRAGSILADGGDFAKARALLEPLTGADRTFRHSARELLALAAWRAGDATAAKRWTDMIAADSLTPSSTRTRVDILNALVAGESKS